MAQIMEQVNRVSTEINDPVNVPLSKLTGNNIHETEIDAPEYFDEKEESKQGNYARREFGYASFKRSFSLPETVEDEQIKAEYKEGVLSIHLPKKEEARKKPVRSIKIS